MGSASKKRNLSVFDAIQELETEDVRAESKRRKRSTAQVQRAKAAQSQTKIYNHLVECRILMQRATVAAQSESSQRRSETGNGVEEHCNALLEELLMARQKLLVGATDESSDSEDDQENEYSELVKGDVSNSVEFQDLLQTEYETCRNEWKEVLDRRHNDLKLHAGLTAKSQFRVMDSSFWQQVDSTVEYERLRSRKPEDDPRDEEESEDEDQGRLPAFDDSKIYQQLLKDFVAQSTATNPEGINRLKSKRSSQNKKKQVDRRASKGRKIRYKEIPKLVNFTFPLSRPQITNLDTDEWFQSLFGGAAKNMS